MTATLLRSLTTVLRLVLLAGPFLPIGASVATPARVQPAASTPATPPGRPKPFIVAVLGDAFGGALAEGLRDGLCADGDYALLPATHAPFGLTADGRFSWSATVPALIAARGFSAAVIMIGANDVGSLRDGLKEAAFGSPAWAALYGARVRAVASAFRDAGLPLTWVGLPIVADDTMAAAYATLNAVIRREAVRAGARYVDSWAAFGDEAGRYDAIGPDRNGRPVRLRTADGRDFTHEGALKLASVVEPGLRRAREAAIATAAQTATIVLPGAPEVDTDIDGQIRRELDLPARRPGSGTGSGPAEIVPDLPTAPDGRLPEAGIGPAPPRTGGSSLAQRVLVEGRPLAPKPGRIDDFAWPRP